MAKVECPCRPALCPLPCVLVSCGDARKGRRNIITIAWCGVIASDPPLVSVSVRPSRLSHSIIRACGDFVINLPPAGLLDEVDRCGTVSGRAGDKFEACGLHAAPARIVSAPMIEECPVNMECVLKQEIEAGSHTAFIAEVAAVHADSRLADPQGNIDYGKAGLIAYVDGTYWNLGEKLGKHGFSRS